MKNKLSIGWALVAAVWLAEPRVWAESAIGGTNMSCELLKDDAGKVTVYATAVSAFREAAMIDPAKAIEQTFSESARSKWQMKIDPNMIVQQQTDFFMGGILLSGPVGSKESVVGLYNPWWDALLALKLRGADPSVPTLARPQVTDFLFMSGETFRGETISTNNVSCVTVVPEKDPLSVELWRVTARTRAHFQKIFPLDGKPAWGKLAAVSLKMDWPSELIVLQSRSLLRMQHSLALLKNARDTGIAAFLTRLARHGTTLQMHKYFGKKECRPLVNTFLEVPKVFRTGFIPYGYVPTETGTLYVLVNKETPRLYMTVTLDREIKASTSGMEWFDLSQADELLTAWNGRKDAAK